MKLLHVSDLHVGKRLQERSLMEDQRHVLGRIVELVGELEADALVVAGDLYDKSNPSSEAVSLVDWFLGEAVATGRPVFVCAGNHDSPERVAYARELLARQGLHLSRAVTPDMPQPVAHHTLELPDGPATFWLVPFVKPATVRAALPDAEVSSYTDALRAVVATCELNPAARNVVVVHQFVTSGSADGTTRYDSETIGTLDNVDASVFEDFDYVALGHLHGAHEVGSPRLRYAGSPLKYSRSEAWNAKSATLVELGPKDGGELAPLNVEAIPLVPLHDLRELRGTLEELREPEVLAAGGREDYVYVTLTDDEPPLDANALVRQSFPNLMQLDFDNAHTRAELAAQGGVADIATERTFTERFADFYESQTGEQLSPEQAALVNEIVDGWEA